MAWVYPRACGGTVPQIDIIALGQGLSPRVRGNPVQEPSNFSWMRSIPARAGEPGNARSRSILAWVYPRACGGTSSAADINRISKGLSRARAGEPRCHLLRPFPPWVYPRACGGTVNHFAGTNDATYGVYPRACGGTFPTQVRPVQ